MTALRRLVPPNDRFYIPIGEKNGVFLWRERRCKVRGIFIFMAGETEAEVPTVWGWVCYGQTIIQL